MQVSLKRRRVTAFGSLICGLLAFCYSLSLAADTVPPVKKNILIVSEVDVTNPAISTVTRELLSALSANRDYQIELFSESLETPAFLDQTAELKAENALINKYRDRKVDIIVAIGPNPIVFMSHFAETFLPNVPVVFCGSNLEQAGHPKLTSRFTGAWMTFDPGRTLDLAVQLLPGTQHVVVVGGTSSFDRMNEAVTKAGFDAHAAQVDITYLTDLTMTALLDRLRHLPAHTIVIYLSLFRDAGGNRFFNAGTALPLVSEAANAPVFSMSDMYVGRGVVGGYVMSFAEQGRIAGEIALEILQGKEAREIPTRISPGAYMFDFRQLRRWRLSESKLPRGSVVLFGEPSFWSQIKWPVLVFVVLLIALGSLTAYLLQNRRQLRLARDEQMRLTGMLIDAQEDERKRLASELHDDFSQRLVVLALQLDAESQKAAGPSRQRLHALLDYASELGSDLHTLSHRLHSSTLERLGLVAGLSAFCDEFTAQHHIPVDFSHKKVNGSVTPETALCLFRITQEALRNIKKHSGASHASVALDSVDKCLHLSISDDGVGFDSTDPAARQGLGISSMAERARLIGARFEIFSSASNGTRIDVQTTTAIEELSRPDSLQPEVIQEHVAD